MKKNFITKLLTVCLSAVSVFTVTSCGSSADKVPTNADFYKTLAQSIKSLKETHMSYDTCVDTTIAYKETMKSESTNSWTYTPDGAEEAVTQTYVEGTQQETSITYSFKNVGDDLLFSADIKTETKHVYYASPDDLTNVPLEAYEIHTITTEQWLFGVQDGKYFARCQNTNEENTPHSEYTYSKKYYRLFDNKESYVDTIKNFLFNINYYYLDGIYSPFGMSGGSNVPAIYDLTLEKGNYSASTGDFTLNANEGTATYIVEESRLTVNAKAPVSFSYRYVTDEVGSYLNETSANLNLSLTSSIQIEPDACNGCEKYDYLDVNDAFEYPQYLPSNSYLRRL